MTIDAAPPRADQTLNQLDVICVGKPNDILAPAIAAYEQKLATLSQVRVASIPGGPTKATPGTPITEEARRVAATVRAIAEERGEKFPIILGDHYGEVVTTAEFTSMATRLPYVCCIVGGLGGLSDALPDWQIDRVSFGRIILSPSLARVVMLDQLYRAMQQSRGVPYDLN